MPILGQSPRFTEMKITKVAIIRKLGLEVAGQMGTEMAQWLARKSISTVFDEIDETIHLIIILGGDGTLLHVAEKAARFGIPVVGINLGSLGFLTEVAVSERYEVMETILAGSAFIEDRMMIKARIQSKQHTGSWRYVLNDVVVSRGSLDRLIQLCTWDDQEYITTYKADGLIFSTPTGSTAYNLSSGGPIVYPGMQSILVTPICPFMLESRPVLLPSTSRLSTKIATSHQDVSVFLDGQQAWIMKRDDKLEVEAAEKPLKLICSSQKGYFDILRSKLNWGGTSLAQKK